EGEGAAPGDALDDPRLDAEVHAQGLEVGDQIAGGLRAEVDRARRTGRRSRPSGAALGEADDPGTAGRRVAAVAGREPPAGPAVQVEGGHPVGGAGFLPVDPLVAA